MKEATHQNVVKVLLKIIEQCNQSGTKGFANRVFWSDTLNEVCDEEFPSGANDPRDGV